MRPTGLAALAFAMAMGVEASAQAACVLNRIATLPVTMRRTSPTTPAKVNGADVVFEVDSGAFFSVISPASASTLKLPLTMAPFGAYMSGIGGRADISVGTVKAFGLSGATLRDIQFIVGGSDITAPAVGVIGQNILGLGDVEYDFADGAVRLFQPRSCGPSPLAYWVRSQAFSTLPIEGTSPGHTATRGVVLVNGVRVHALFDTGASASQITPAAAARAGVKTNAPGVISAGIVRGFGARVEPIWNGAFANVQIGDEQIHNTHLFIGDLGGGDDEMLVGADFFLSHRVYVANSQRKLYFTYVGGPVFDLSHSPRRATTPDQTAATTHDGASAPAADGQEEPQDADAFSRRGEVRAARRDYDDTETDLTHAIALAPQEPKYLTERAGVRLALRKRVLALADLDAALKLKSDDAAAHLTRARLRFADRDREGAKADLDAAATASSKEADLRLALASAYIDLDEFEPAVEQATLWIASHGDDSRLAQALNGRCWARALWGQQLDAALSDCNRAVRLSGRDAQVLDTRGLVYLRRGELDRARAEYDAALASNPKIAWSLYGRGVVELKAGERAKGDADMAAAAALAPHLADRAARLGIAP